MPPFCLQYEKSSPVNIVYRKINWQNPASISAYTQSEYRISNYVNHIRIIVLYILCWYLCPCTYVLFSESLIENWYNPIKLRSLNKDLYLFILFIYIGLTYGD